MRDVTQVRRAHRVVHLEQRIVRVQQRLFLVHVHRRQAGTPRLQCGSERARLDQAGAAGIDDQRAGLHAREVRRGRRGRASPASAARAASARPTARTTLPCSPQTRRPRRARVPRSAGGPRPAFSSRMPWRSGPARPRSGRSRGCPASCRAARCRSWTASARSSAPPLPAECCAGRQMIRPQASSAVAYDGSPGCMSEHSTMPRRVQASRSMCG